MRTLTPLAAVLALAASVVAAPGAAASLPTLPGLPDPGSVVQQLTGGCDGLDPRACLLPFPNDRFTVLDASTPTGRRVDLDLAEMPRNVVGKPIDPTEWNHNDGFSPGSPILTFVPDLDLARTYRLDPTPESGAGVSDDPWAVRDRRPDAVIEAPQRSMRRNAPIVLLDADTGRRHPYWAELDANAGTVDSGADQALVIRPLRNLEEGRRYIVALRGLRASDGRLVPAGDAFSALRDRFVADCAAAGPRGCDRRGRFPAPADLDPADTAARYADIFRRLNARGVDVSGLQLAWDFHVASTENLAGRALAIRDDAFARLGDTDLADGRVQGEAPDFAVTEVVDEAGSRTVRGTVTVPNYLSTPQDDLVEVEGFGLVVPQGRFHYGASRSGPTDLPEPNPLLPTTEAEFTCRFRTDLASVRPMLYGHGLLGSREEAVGGSSEDLRRSGYAACGVDWIGMATEDVPNVALALLDMSFFPSLPDRSQQGFLNFLYVGRALLHPDGLGTDPAFAGPDGSLLDTTELFYDGNSQGGILGGALTALAPDFTKAVLGVPGMNYSTLLNRSVDWEGELVDPADPGLPAYASVLYSAYPDKVEQQLVFALMQMLWDRGEGNGFAHHMTDDPLPNTPAHQVLLEVAFGDYQVANVAAEVLGRTVGADFLGTALAAGRHWERGYSTGRREVPYGFRSFLDGRAAGGSGLVYWDSGNPIPPNANVPPWSLDQDPHSDPRKDDTALRQKLRFFRTGVIRDVSGGQPNWTQNCPRHPEQDPGC